MLFEYLAFIRGNARPLLFGVLLTALSSFGQTFFIALSGAALRSEFALSDGLLGLAYAVATTTSGISLGWAGRLIDVTSLRLYAAGAAAVLVAGCLGMTVSVGFWSLAAAFLMLRLGGQGLLSHTAMTATARRFQNDPGKALALVSLGYALGEAVLPPLAVTGLAVVGWRVVGCVRRGGGAGHRGGADVAAGECAGGGGREGGAGRAGTRGRGAGAVA